LRGRFEGRDLGRPMGFAARTWIVVEQ
jgi:hypothetical protein